MGTKKTLVIAGVALAAVAIFLYFRSKNKTAATTTPQTAPSDYTPTTPEPINISPTVSTVTNNPINSPYAVTPTFAYLYQIASANNQIIVQQANPNRKYILIQNQDATNNVAFRFTGTGLQDANFILGPGKSYIADSAVPTAQLELLSVASPTVNVAVMLA